MTSPAQINNSLFDALDDETPPSTGQEIGAAVSGALTEVAKSNLQLADKLTQAMTLAMREIPRQENMPKPVQKWVFQVERDSRGLISQITASAVGVDH